MRSGLSRCFAIVTLCTAGCASEPSAAGQGHLDASLPDASIPIAPDAAVDGSRAPVGDEAVPDAGDPSSRSGTRIRVHAFSAAGGAIAERTQSFDMEAQVPCKITLAEDGVLRCLPDGNGVSFRDPACTVPIAAVSTCGLSTGLDGGASRLNPFVIDGISSEEPCVARQTVAVYRVGARIERPATVYLRGGDGCVSRESGASEEFRDLSHVDPAEFVRFDEKRIVLTSRLAIDVREGADGTRLEGTLRERETSAACSPMRLSPDDVAFCAPRDPVGGGYGFADPACTRPLLIQLSSCPGNVALVYQEKGPMELYAVGAGLGVDSAFGPDCSKGANDYVRTAARALFAPGRRVQATELPAVDELRVGEGRLRALRYSAGGRFVPRDRSLFFDTKLGMTCVPMGFSDGSFYCIPEELPRYASYDDNLLFADANCSIPVIALSEPVAPFVYTPLLAECASDTRVYRVGTKTPVSYGRHAGVCQPETGPTGYELTRIDPADEFVEVTTTEL